MAIYGDLDHVRALLRPKDGAPLSDDVQTRLTSIQVAVSSYIEEQTGRTFGDPAAASSVIVDAAFAYVYGQRVGASPRLQLPKAVRTVTSVTYEPEWNGSAWSGGDVVDPGEYRPVYVNEHGEAMALESVGGGNWYGRYLVTGTWEDSDDDDEVPGDIVYIADYLIAEVFKAEQTSAAAVSGPDGSTLPMKNPYKNALVQTVLDKYRISSRIVI